MKYLLIALIAWTLVSCQFAEEKVTSHFEMKEEIVELNQDILRLNSLLFELVKRNPDLKGYNKVADTYDVMYAKYYPRFNHLGTLPAKFPNSDNGEIKLVRLDTLENY